MDSDEETYLIRQLAYQWARLELPTTRLSYADDVRTISGLQEATRNPGRTTYLFLAVIRQASELGKTSEWVERELRFEALAHFVENRMVMLVLDLENGPIDDESLDLYNERMNRFVERS